MQEIEYKYLLKPSVLKLRVPGTKCHALTQFYTKVSEKVSVRYRQMDGRCFKTVKKGTGAVREEFEKEIACKRVRKKRKKRVGFVVRKQRCLFDLEERRFSVDIFGKPLAGLYLLEVEFPDKSAFDAFRLPEVLQPYVVREVTEDERYKNKNLACFGLPVEKDDPRKAARVLLEKLCLLKEAAEREKRHFLQMREDEALHRFRVAWRRTLSILQSFAFVWQDGVSQEYRKMLREIIAVTNFKRDLDVMQKRLKKVQKSIDDSKMQRLHAKLMKEVEKLRAREERYIVAYFQSSRFMQSVGAYEAWLERGYDRDLTFYGSYAMESLCAFVLCRRFRKVRRLHRKIDYRKEWERLHKLRICVKKLRYVFESCDTLQGAKDMKTVVSDMKRLQKSLGAFHDAHRQKEIFSLLAKTMKDEQLRAFVQERLVGQIHRCQQQEINAIRDEVEAFLQHKKIFRRICAPAT